MKRLYVLAILLCFTVELCAACAQTETTSKDPFKDGVAATKQCLANGTRYVARLLVPWEVEIRVAEKPGTPPIFRFSSLKVEDISYDVLSGAHDLVVRDLDGDGNDEVAWKFCRHHFCPSQNGAILYDIAKRALYRIEFDEDAKNPAIMHLPDPPKPELANWLLKWWKEWPGR